MLKDQMKQNAARAALDFIVPGTVIGIGSGSTVNFFIENLASRKDSIKGAISSSKESSRRLEALGIAVLDLNGVDEIPIYVDGADEINEHFQMIKGGGGALTSEKIVASVAKKFVCIADRAKSVKLLGKFPVAIEVIPMARSYVAREVVKLGGMPVYRQGFVTDHGNVILDVHYLNLLDPPKLEAALNNIAGVVENGIFAKRCADVLILGYEDHVEKFINA
ncbi:MAG: ribose-5-phosphate isomerase RpiA [Gammaproteobacteria bacterium]|nr:ribose-5-phosphate isomerase RpiA [Gammaproteobacteria bacterium]